MKPYNKDLAQEVSPFLHPAPGNPDNVSAHLPKGT